MTTRADLEIDLDPPPAARPGAVAVIEAVEECIQGQVLLLATNDTSYDPDLLAWLRTQGLLSSGGLDAPEGESVMADRYGEHHGRIEDETDEMRRRNDSVNNSTVSAFDTTNQTFQDIMSKVEALQDELAQAPGPVEGEQHMPIDAEYALIRSALTTLDDVIGLVDDAQTGMETHAEEIDRSNPYTGNGGNSGTSGGSSPSNYHSVTAASDAKVLAVGDAPNDIVAFARKELNRGVGEFGEDNLRYLDRRGGKPDYDIGGAWCSAFATDMWKRAGYNVDWTYKDRVQTVWNDANAMGLNRPEGEAPQPGDLIVFKWSDGGDHIGIVDRVEGNTVHTIEGNSSDSLTTRKYSLNDPEVVGYVRPPADEPAPEPSSTVAV
ncbi:CHAP domain-containing protein [Nocardia sp. NPDC051750]|uniref:CHAP domain-containing protein n=1 Tax=Nocardia sp. NPDC051750 TaxID=3364325 RepID=UPI0037B6D548